MLSWGYGWVCHGSITRIAYHGTETLRRTQWEWGGGGEAAPLAAAAVATDADSTETEVEASSGANPSGFGSGWKVEDRVDSAVRLQSGWCWRNIAVTAASAAAAGAAAAAPPAAWGRARGDMSLVPAISVRDALDDLPIEVVPGAGPPLMHLQMLPTFVSLRAPIHV